MGNLPSRPLTSLKARAWNLAARMVARSITGSGADLEVLCHIRDAVLPALRRKAEIIERNQRYDPTGAARIRR